MILSEKTQLHAEKAVTIALSWMIIIILVLFYLTWFPALVSINNLMKLTTVPCLFFIFL